MTAAILLAGGQGTRLQAVWQGRPKALAPVAGRPFIDYLIAQLAQSGAFSKIVIAAGYKAEALTAHCAAIADVPPIVVSVEPSPLGTGGALLHALSDTEGETVAVLNGDSFVNIDVAELLADHDAAATIVAVRAPERGCFGALELSGDRLVGFSEKGSDGPGWINAGVYVFQRAALNDFTPGILSLETDIMPTLIPSGVNVVRANSAFIDIGTPADFARADAFFAALDLYGIGPGT